MDRTNELKRGRVLAVVWQSGKKTKLILDQGVGYWLRKTQYRDETFFDLRSSLEVQATCMTE
ncbi:hypothetical protein [Burkholderia pseudomallei]|uniref:hypothetical protein n=1 Tax=Burkholderia pseudomallei TaxID=28450 RepID=UPI0011CEBA83|nr:hypothetical protein [Burkholderia pseudomallei]